MYQINKGGHLLTGALFHLRVIIYSLNKFLICKVGTENQYQFHGVIVDVKVLTAVPNTEEMFNKWKQLWKDISPEY